MPEFRHDPILSCLWEFAYRVASHLKRSLNFCRYEDLKTAASQPDGLAVLGVFFQVSTKDNPYIDRLINGVLHVKMPGKEVALKKVIRLKDLLPGQAKHFFRYRGSLTTPPCSESVTWYEYMTPQKCALTTFPYRTVFVQPVEVSASQLWQLRSLFDLDDKKLADNFRPVQPINRRKVFINKKNYNRWTVWKIPSQVNWDRVESSFVDKLELNSTFAEVRLSK